VILSISGMVFRVAGRGGNGPVNETDSVGFLAEFGRARRRSLSDKRPLALGAVRQSTQ
jgi:hypothetical protein